MSKQMDLNDLIPNTLKELSRKFVDEEYLARHHDGALPLIRTRHEAYGKMAEGYVTVNSAMDGVKASMRDCLKSLAGTDFTYKNAAEDAYNCLLDTFMATAEFAVQTLNCIYQMDGIIQANPLPLEDVSLNDTLDDTGSENTDLMEEEEDDE